jgi:hypothetical protein
MVKRGWYLPGLLQVRNESDNGLIELHHFCGGSFVGRREGKININFN